jgi:hypothetical protein
VTRRENFGLLNIKEKAPPCDMFFVIGRGWGGSRKMSVESGVMIDGILADILNAANCKCKNCHSEWSPDCFFQNGTEESPGTQEEMDS